jgi:hypothetical protein
MSLIVGKRYSVVSGHKFYGGMSGVFEFMGGPNADVVVLCNTSRGYKQYICVEIQDIEQDN